MFLVQYFPSILWVTVCFFQAMVMMSLIHIVTDLEKLTERKTLPNNWSFQKKVWFSVALFSSMMVGTMVGFREVISQMQNESQIRIISDNSGRIEMLEKEIKELKAKLPK